MPPNIVNQLLGILLPWILLFGLISILGTLFRAVVVPNLKGRLGEAKVNLWARQLLDQNTYHLIPDVMLPTPDGTTQIDHVIVSRYGIFVLETKTYRGWIYGDERESQWTQVNFRRKDRFQNPLRQNYRHTKTLSDLMGLPAQYFKSVVVFAGDCTFKTAMPANVVHVRDFVRYITSFQTPMIKSEQVPEVVDTIRQWAATVTEVQKAGHVASVRSRKASVSASGHAPACPRCRTGMVLRTNRKDGSQFWGCPRYPGCRGTRKAA